MSTERILDSKAFLVVNKSLVEAMMAQTLLQQRWPECQILMTTNTKEARQIIAVRKLTAVLLDVQLAKSAGLELITEIKKLYADVPVILLTGFRGADAAGDALKAGASTCVSTARLWRSLIPTVESMLQLAQTYGNRRRTLSNLHWTEMRFELDNETHAIGPLVRNLQDQIGSMQLLPDADLLQIGVALHESLLNAICHGNLELDSALEQEDEQLFQELAATRRIQWPYCDRKVIVDASFNRDRAKFVIRDGGPGFQPEQFAGRADTNNVPSPRGRGLVLIHNFMDEVNFNSVGNEITLIKYTSPAKALLAKLADTQTAGVDEDFELSSEVLLLGEETEACFVS
jgi:CheY-like chemotaxis protein/anti-sigma regulatory factor (Ser/Thr protein kinase)